MSRLSCIAVVVLVAACSKKADPPPAPTTTAPAQAQPSVPAPAADAAPAPVIQQLPGEAAILYGEEQVRQACTLVVTLRDRIAACEGGGKAVDGEQEVVDSLKAALDKGIPSADLRAQAMAACQRTEQRLRTIATDIKCAL